MEIDLARWSLIVLCFSMAGAFGGGLYEHVVLTPLGNRSPPSSFSIIQRGTGIPGSRRESLGGRIGPGSERLLMCSLSCVSY